MEGTCAHFPRACVRPSLSEVEQNKPWLTGPNPKLTPAWLGGLVQWRRAIKGRHS